jgi:hypothetical protein
MATNYNVQYNIPRVQVQMAGRQNRLTDGNFRITPSMTEPVKFLFGNQDGVPLKLQEFKIHFVVWEISHTIEHDMSMGQSNVLLNKRILVDDPYSAEVEMILSSTDTILLGNHAAGQNLNWSLFMINTAGEVFPMQVSNHGGRFGTMKVDFSGGIPIAELIRAPLA